ncbi:hypothetical protein BST20_24355 [Mycobacterium branderi]|uniref:Uncharacterized protein n=1 Tax=Mycobacterium branderi TaxID=43348 RepID=A0AA91LSP8_9MYCO|nr:hypothetical protein BST20_24355 [Mycobacterium branderi]
MLVAKCEALGLTGDELHEEILRTVTTPHIRGPLPPLPPVRTGPPDPDETIEYPLSLPEFVEIADENGISGQWQIVRYDEPNLAGKSARIYPNGFRLLWSDAGLPAELPDGSPLPVDAGEVVVISGPSVFGGVLVRLPGLPAQQAWVRHDQLVVRPTLAQYDSEDGDVFRG